MNLSQSHNSTLCKHSFMGCSIYNHAVNLDSILIFCSIYKQTMSPLPLISRKPICISSVESLTENSIMWEGLVSVICWRNNYFITLIWNFSIFWIVVVSWWDSPWYKSWGRTSSVQSNFLQCLLMNTKNIFHNELWFLLANVTDALSYT